MKNFDYKMLRVNYIMILFLFIGPQLETFATAQIPDILIYQGDTLSIFANPLEDLYENDSIRPKFFGDKKACNSTACWRGYQAEWEITDNHLYLIGIYSCCYDEDSIKANLKVLFSEKCINGKVEAKWFTGKIIAPKGKLLYYIHMGYESLYEKEFEMEFSYGILVETKTYDNSRSRQSVLSRNSDKLFEFIYSHIKWESLPKLEGKNVRVFVQFSANQSGIVDSAVVLRGFDSVYDKEAIRVIKSIPEWDVYCRHGIFQRMNWTFPVVFSEENRKKYYR